MVETAPRTLHDLTVAIQEGRTRLEFFAVDLEPTVEADVYEGFLGLVSVLVIGSRDVGRFGVTHLQHGVRIESVGTLPLLDCGTSGDGSVVELGLGVNPWAEYCGKRVPLTTWEGRKEHPMQLANALLPDRDRPSLAGRCRPHVAVPDGFNCSEDHAGIKALLLCDEEWYVAGADGGLAQLHLDAFAEWQRRATYRCIPGVHPAFLR